MSAEAEWAAVSALDAKAFKLCDKGHFARGAEAYGVAAAAAQALGHVDCLVTALLQVDEAHTRITHTRLPGVGDDDLVAALTRTYDLLGTAVATLQRRKAAGTLLAGACRPAEEAWNRARHRFQPGALQRPRHRSPGTAAGGVGPAAAQRRAARAQFGAPDRSACTGIERACRQMSSAARLRDTAHLRAGGMRRVRGACCAVQEVRRMPGRGVLLQGAPGAALAGAQGGLQGGAQSFG
jgi:hypothetical protein